MNTIRELFKILTDNSKGYTSLALPSFQREFVWSVENQKSLIASVLSNVPCTSSLIVQSNSDKVDFLCRGIGKNSKQRLIDIPRNSEMNYLLDGQQRFSTLYYAFSNVYSLDSSKLDDNIETLESLFSSLCYRWFLSFASCEDTFGYERIRFDPETFDSYLPEFFLDNDIIIPKKLTPSGNEAYSIRSTWDELSQWCKENKCLPLFLFFDPQNSYKIQSLLRQFQISRIESLINSHKFEELKSAATRVITGDLYNYHCEILKSNETPEAEKLNSFNYLRSILDDLASEWSNQLSDYLTSRIKEYRLNPIILNDVNKAVSTYTFINTGGTRLSVFDLICARSKFDLRDKIQNGILGDFEFYNRKMNKVKVSFDNSNKFGMFDDKKGWDTGFAMFVIHVYNLVYFKSQKFDIEKLPTNFSKVDYSLSHLRSKFIDENSEYVIEIIQKVCYLVHAHCGHVKFSDITNKLILLPLANAFIWTDQTDDKLINRLKSFFWIKLFSGDYDSHQNDMSFNDCKKIVKWIKYSDQNVIDELVLKLDNDVLNRAGFSDRSITTSGLLKTNNSLVNNLMYYLRSAPINGIHDFDKAGTEIDIETKHEIHHLIPLAQVSTIGQGTKDIRKKPHPLNALMNLTPISKNANLEIGRFDLGNYQNRLKTAIRDEHHLSAKWVNFQYVDNDPSSQRTYQELLDMRHESIAKQMRNDFRNHLN